MKLTEVLAGLADVVFPPCCASCSAVFTEGEGPLFCRGCERRIPALTPPLCPRCGISVGPEGGGDHLCGACLAEEPPFDLARALGRYETVLLEAIHRFKYGGQSALGKKLGRRMAAFPFPGFDGRAFDAVLPVPLHVRRLRERGYNQSLLLAREIARAYRLPLDFQSLQRTQVTAPQVELGRRARQDNVRGAFAVVWPERVEGRRLLLVDDVFTTGSTIGECCRVLRKAGAARIAVLTLARAVA